MRPARCARLLRPGLLPFLGMCGEPTELRIGAPRCAAACPGGDGGGQGGQAGRAMTSGDQKGLLQGMGPAGDANYVVGQLGQPTLPGWWPGPGQVPAQISRRKQSSAAAARRPGRLGRRPGPPDCAGAASFDRTQRLMFDQWLAAPSAAAAVGSRFGPARPGPSCAGGGGGGGGRVHVRWVIAWLKRRAAWRAAAMTIQHGVVRL